MKMKTALITGASSGIGKELARIHASRGGNVVLVARRGEELESLRSELENKYKVDVSIFQQDLSKQGAAKNVYDFCKEKNIEIEYLINNAGFGGHGNFVDRPLEKDIEMIHLNIQALVELSHLFLQDMKKSKSGKILNTASSAGFLPGPLQATYFATKAFVVSFTKGISHELKPHGITVTALCPGPVKTEFEFVAGMGNGDMFKNGATAYSTALKGYNAMMKGKRICISDLGLNFMIKFLLPVIPDTILLRVIQKMQTI
ncbi:MAG: SDR family oxidoreductase [Bacteroidetes bacterium]|nr:SDR family oxidoreductase [Bacteroidota bacterium]